MAFKPADYTSFSELSLSNAYSLGGVYPKQLVIYSTTDGRRICLNAECAVSSNSVANRLYANITAIYKFFWQRFGLKGIDGNGSIVPIFIDWNAKNAQWECRSDNGHNTLCAWRFNNIYAVTLSVVAHEYFHGIVAKLRPLTCCNEPGGLNEALADIFGVIANQTITGNWNDWSVGGLRDLSQHADKDDFRVGTFDNGFVHHNGRIIGHGFFASVKGYDNRSDGKIADVFFQAFLTITSNETFKGFAIKTVLQAQTLFNGVTASSVFYAWVHVGLLQLDVPKPVPSTTFSNGKVGKYTLL